MPPAWRVIVLASLVVSAMMFGLVGCGDDDDGGNTNGNGNNTVALCEPGETKYYCVETTVTVLPGAAAFGANAGSAQEDAFTYYGVENICDGDGEGIIDPDCDIKQNGSNVSVTCAFTEEVSATCSVTYDYTMSGTVTDQLIDLSGTAVLTPQGSCPPDVPVGTIEVAIHGDRVDGPDAPCGESSGGSGFSLTVTKPGGTVTPDAITVQAIGDPTNGYTVMGTFTDASSMTYTTSVLVPPVSSVPANFTIVDPDGSGPGEAEVVHIEAKFTNPVYTFGLTSASGTLTITKATESELAGSFNATGSGDVIEGMNQSVEDRTLAGEFDTSVSAGSDFSVTAADGFERHHARFVRTILKSLASHVEGGGSGVVSP
jgi:hypothetical protein